ncbi:DoxX family protein [Cohnella sp. REN36]|uniref:DoxX family protein n=1 Tax=Cohnella sp. REN36 TaxID=2887347 RepID=UPI001D13F16B|nr:DoxX family protein [Cohnella sp. REN36]MCC3374436.1 DoxX family protein [Cohnella sp. REN36]
MNVALWIAQGLLAAMFLMAGSQKLFGKPNAEQPAAMTKFIGLTEVLGAIGLILPGALDIAPDLTGAAAVGIAVIMLLAAMFHAKRKETQGVVMTVVLLLIALFVVIGRFGLEPF